MAWASALRESSLESCVLYLVSPKQVIVVVMVILVPLPVTPNQSSSTNQSLVSRLSLLTSSQELMKYGMGFSPKGIESCVLSLASCILYL